ncbi:MAG: DUF2795 domain-containing protein [Chloroflexota bacterium]
MNIRDAYTHRVYLARVRDFVEGATFPASRADVLAYARNRNTPSDIFSDLTRLKADRFASLDEVVAAVDALHFAGASR